MRAGDLLGTSQRCVGGGGTTTPDLSLATNPYFLARLVSVAFGSIDRRCGIVPASVRGPVGHKSLAECSSVLSPYPSVLKGLTSGPTEPSIDLYVDRHKRALSGGIIRAEKVP